MAWEDKRMVIVEWRDANCGNSWDDPHTVPSLSTVFSIGLLWNESDEAVMIVGTVAEDGNVNQVMNIPRNCITNIEDIK